MLKSWAVTNEPSLDPAVKRLAVRVEDHPLAYAGFSGTIPEGHYGAGEVSIWDHGTFENLDPAHTIADGLDAGKLSFALHGERLNGRFSLVRMRGGKGKRENWLLIKGRDEHAATGSAARNPPARRRKRGTARRRPRRQGLARRSRRAGGGGDHPPGQGSLPGRGASPRPTWPRTTGRSRPGCCRSSRTARSPSNGCPTASARASRTSGRRTPRPPYPAWIPRVELETERGKPVAYVLVNDLPTLLYLVNQGALTFHPWLSRVGSLDRPDFVLFDLDPGEAPFADVVAVARRLHERADGRRPGGGRQDVGEDGAARPGAAGSRQGGYDEARAWALGVAGRVAERAAGHRHRRDSQGEARAGGCTST